jgi:hypothetical protein
MYAKVSPSTLPPPPTTGYLGREYDRVALEGRCFALSACQFLLCSDFPEDMSNVLSDELGQELMRDGEA